MNEKEDDIFYIDEEKYNSLKDKIIKMVEEKYLKTFYKEVKIFQIIMAGYNASQQKDLRSFWKYGWDVFQTLETKNIMSIVTFERRILPNMKCWIRTVKNNETGVLKLLETRDNYVTIVVNNEIDIELYNLIKQFNDETDCDGDIFGNNFLKLFIRYQPDSCWYCLDITCKI